MRQNLRFTHLFLLALTGVLAVSIITTIGCNRYQSGQLQQAGARQEGRKLFRIGYQRGGELDIMRVRGDLEKRLVPLGVTVEFTSFPAGPQLLEALGVGSIDLGSTGDAPAIFAQVAGLPLAYVANSPPEETGDSRGILVPNDSPIHSLADLRGKRIAIQKGSGTHNFLVQALEKAGIPYQDIHPIYLAPPDARPAFDSGSVDAWAIWDPYLLIAQKTTGARLLINGKGIVSAGSFYLSTREFARSHPDWIKIALKLAEEEDRWSAEHPHEAAALIAPELGVDASILEQVIARAHPRGQRYAGFRPIDSEVIAAQQTVADNFYRIGLLPKRVDVRAGMLTPREYEALTPQADEGARSQ